MRQRLRSTAAVAVIGLLTSLASCWHNDFVSPTAGSQDVKDTPRSPHFRVLSPLGGAVGKSPQGPLTEFNGILYGTTYLGGKNGTGVVFSITPSGATQVVYDFCAASVCAGSPITSLTNIGGTFYGTTYLGGTHGSGTIFSVTPSGNEEVLYSFGSIVNDGSNPRAGLTDVNGLLFGTTEHGGRYGQGTVFTVDPQGGKENVLHSFGNGKDGALPSAGLVGINGSLFGTTAGGGKNTQGALFKVAARSGAERVLYSFTLTGGFQPVADMLFVSGALYGTTSLGGAYGRGAVFRADPTSGAVKTLFSFGKTIHDGTSPQAALTYLNGTFYGTTSFGGLHGDGTIFSMTLTGSERVLYSFSRTDGIDSLASLLLFKKVLYGTTSRGGRGDGTIFAFSP
jgi:uncharacterized repeat protein (TIGR03803 family)